MYLKYLKYVIRHKWFVFVECCKAGIIWRGVVHDLSKFLPSEFFPYAEYFYGDKTLEKECDDFRYWNLKDEKEKPFDKAWLMHQHRNPHHWQFWLLQEDDGPRKNIPIPLKYLKEMLCDWRGAGRAINGKDNTLEWYMKNKDKINLRLINKSWVEKKLGYGHDQCTNESQAG